MKLTETNWTKWSAISEILSSVAIILTLGYLAIEIHQNTVAIKAEARTTLWEMHIGIIDHMIQYPEIRFTWSQQEPLTDEQRVRLSIWLFKFVGHREFMWLQYRDGIVDEQTWETLLSDLDQLWLHPRIRSWWELTSDFYFDPEFVRLVNTRASGDPSTIVPDWLAGWEE